MLLPPDRCTLHGTSEEVEDSTDGTYVTMDVQLIPMRVRPLLLLRRRHANPEQIRVGSIDGINDSLVVLIRELRLIRRRTNWDSRIYFMNFALMNCGTFQAIFISFVNITGLKPYPDYTLMSSSHIFFRLAESVLIPPMRILVTNSGRYATFRWQLYR